MKSPSPFSIQSMGTPLPPKVSHFNKTKNTNLLKNNKKCLALGKLIVLRYLRGFLRGPYR